MIMISATPLDTDSHVHLAEALAAAGLPIADLDQPVRSFFRFDADATVGFGGLEGEGADRLLRSLVVLPALRHCGIGRAILAALQTAARELGAQRLHLLATTAAPFFRAHGYCDIDRGAAPASIAGTEQFARLCPASAAYLVKSLENLS
ncbi:MAG TPA: arsenic resistance N-acetyltransferase ArsN2 [Sphingomonas sp.]|jgi:amino-acid N-acetyltransferase|nr:arsenic resistance N-acetyltransferase ArsN2 [Sphingomonas sp.]